MKFAICLHESGFTELFKANEKDYDTIVPKCAKEFGISWKIVQIKVMPQNRLSGFAFIDESNDDIEPV